MNYKSSLSAFYIALILNLRSWIRAEFYTAITDIEPLLETYKRIIDDLDSYIEKEEKRLAVLKKNVELYRKEHITAMEDVPNYLGNPINAFTLIKRLTTDLNFIEKYIKAGTEYFKNITVNYTDVKYPTEEDLLGAVHALKRLQYTYHLDIGELANGRLTGNSDIQSTPMTASDCFELGRILYNEKDYKNSVRWMMAALSKYIATNDVYDFTEVDILEYISYLHYLMGDSQTALDWTSKILALNPMHQRTLSNIPYYLKNIIDKKNNFKENSTEEGTKIGKISLEKENKVYESLCRGEMDLPNEINKRYLTEKHAFLKLAPIKTEQVYIDPDIFMYHQVLSDEEIEHIKSMAKPRFKRATVRGHDGEQSIANYRISKSAWLRDVESPVVARVSRRVSDFTGLSIITAEELQVVNYGIGGHYESHFDFARKYDSPYLIGNGNRIATVLFYMSEVAQGGATVFTELGLSVFPKKNAAVFWMNLHPSGEGDIATRHAACPVLRGSKWVSNKWIHQEGQELLRPCNLEYQREDVMRNITRAIPQKL